MAASASPLDMLNAAAAIRSGGRSKVVQRGYATPVDGLVGGGQPEGDYAFEVAASNLRFGEGVTRVSLPLALSFFHTFPPTSFPCAAAHPLYPLPPPPFLFPQRPL